MGTLLAYPNVSEGRDVAAIAQIAEAFGPGLLDVHSDPDHHRSAFTIAGGPGELAGAVIAGARRTLELTGSPGEQHGDAADGGAGLDGHDGVHPRVGALDVAPIIWLREDDRGAACVEALVLADRLADELHLPVLLYGALAGGRTRAELRRGGHRELSRRVADGELRPDFGPARLDSRAGATLVAARPPLVAFNLRLERSATLEDARRVAAEIREGGSVGLPGVRALGLWLARRDCAQLSTNLEDPVRTTPGAVLTAVARRVPVAGAELVGLAPEAALRDFPRDVRLDGRATIEDALAARARSV